MDKETNDALRAKIPYILPPDVLVITRGIAALGPKAVADILLMVKEFSEFNEDNDPWNEHDFGSFYHWGRIRGCQADMGELQATDFGKDLRGGRCGNWLCVRVWARDGRRILERSGGKASHGFWKGVRCLGGGWASGELRGVVVGWGLASFATDVGKLVGQFSITYILLALSSHHVLHKDHNMAHLVLLPHELGLSLHRLA